MIFPAKSVIYVFFTPHVGSAYLSSLLWLYNLLKFLNYGISFLLWRFFLMMFWPLHMCGSIMFVSGVVICVHFA